MSTSKEIRGDFLDYFASRGHQIVPSSPLVPGNDPTLLFTNAGMVQFKDVFLGTDKRSYHRAVTSQRCVRAGGKHNDLENVGYTARHHTFFEMLGNFSFGDYFKREAIGFCWELLTERFNLPPEKLWVTVYEEDDEAEAIWFDDIGIDRKRFSRCSAKDNFWSMGDTGPCGPCSEVFFDHGPSIPGGPPGSPEEDGDRYIEIWNLVFMQFDRAADGTMAPLPKPSVDTGMGLERLAAVLQDVHSNYEIDLFQALIKATGEVTHAADLESKSLRVIADHIRASAFLVCDGVLPSNEGRGYVLRRIIRRAIRHGHMLGVTEPFFYRIVDALAAEMGDAYPELVDRQGIVERTLQQEEERFAETLDQGMRILDQSIARLSDKRIPGETLFKLYDTYGFPVDLTADIAREREMTVDMEGFEAAMETQRARARSAGKWTAEIRDEVDIGSDTKFVGYEDLSVRSEVVALLSNGKPVDLLRPEEQGMVVLDCTPFYAESGGQVGDSGILIGDGKTRFEVKDTQRHGSAVVHVGVAIDGEVRVGGNLLANVDKERRIATARNHSATHLLHAALRAVLGEHVQQKGSLVTSDRLRFDFSHFEPLVDSQLREIERLVNEQVIDNAPAQTRLMPLEDAKESGAIALFGEKYDDPVRVLSLGSFSTELCGGTHVARCGDVGLFKLTSETGVAAGVRRVEAVTGRGALDWLSATEGREARVASLLKADRAGIPERVEQLLARTKELERELDRLQNRLATASGDDLLSQAVEIAGLKVLAARLDGVDAKRLPGTVDQLKSKLGTGAVLLATVNDDRVSLVAGVTENVTDRIAAGPLVNFVAQQVGGRGGGRPEMARAGGSEPEKLDQAIGSVVNWVKEQIEG